MIDLHCHVLPGLDDGARDMEEAVGMCELAARDGIRTIVATPHTLNGVYENKREAVLEAVLALRDVLRGRGVEVEVLPGSDASMDARLISGVREGAVTTINDGGRSLLLELPRFFVPGQARDLVFDLGLMGVTPVLSHPERNEAAMGDLGALYEMIKGGALVQITAGSVTGRFGERARKNALVLLEHSMVHILATDAHDTSARPPLLSEAVEAASRHVGREAASRMVGETPGALVAGERPEVEGPRRAKKRGFFSFFRPRGGAADETRP